MIPMKLIKAAGEHVKLECKCGRQFWYSPVIRNTTVCPNCKEEWDGIHITEFEKERCFVAKVKLEDKDEEMIVFAASAEKIDDFMIKFFTISKGLSSSPKLKGLRFDEITEEELKKIKEAIATENRSYLADMIVLSMFRRVFGDKS